MTAHISADHFVPNPPELTESFFEPEPKVVELPPQVSVQPRKNFDLKNVTLNIPDIITANVSTEDLVLYQNFVDQCISKYTYVPTPFGLVCPGHPDALYPYPGPMPENPHADKTVVGQFIQRGFSTKFRDEERAYKDALRHWEVQMNHHIMEVPSLQAKDLLFQGYVALLHNRTEEAIELASVAQQVHAFNANALALLVIAYSQKGDLLASARYEKKLLEVRPASPLNTIGHLMLENIIQIALLDSYKGACQGTLAQLDDLNLNIPLQKGLLKDMIQANLIQTCNDRFGVEGIDFLDLITLYFIDEITAEGPTNETTELSKNVETHFPHLAEMFESIEENIILISEADKWSEFPAVQALEQEGFNKSPSQDKAWIKQVIEELTHPVSFGDENFKRAFMLNAMKIQMGKVLFELGPALKEPTL